jgi:hypothetical protein
VDTEGKSFSPPYNIPFATFINTVEKIANDLPNKVDRSYLGSASGSIKSYLISAFRAFGLIDDDLFVTDRLRELARSTDDRPRLVGELLQERYPLAVKLGASNATPGELDAAFAEMFPSVTGESRTKAMRFYLSASDFAGLPKSPLWKSPKVGTGPKRGRPKKNQQNGLAGGTGGTLAPAGQGLRSFTLPSGTVLTVSIDRDVIGLDRDERKFVMEVIDTIEEYEEKHPFVPPPKPKGTKADPPGEDADS